MVIIVKFAVYYFCSGIGGVNKKHIELLNIMCGIVGAIAWNKNGQANFKHITHALKVLAKRGPDFADYHTNQQLCFGHTRLSIIDTTEAANQPFFDESKRFCLVFNGEIYNYRPLRRRLIRLGYKFTSNSDTEVLLKAYQHWGVQMFNQINGFFAFAIYDALENTVLLARDPLGIKPLLVYQDEDQLIFSSEMKGILAFSVQKTLDYTSLFTYLQLNYTVAPHTIFKQVKKIMPGTYWQINLSKKTVSVESYYTTSYEAKNDICHLSYHEAGFQLQQLIEESVRKRMIADVPLGCFLSGGVDSSIISSCAAKYQRQLQTFSLGFSDASFFDETHYAETVAKHLGVQHHSIRLLASDVLNNLFDIVDYLDEPFADSSALAVFMLSKYTRKHVKVALSGDGGDELFAGYNKHAAEYRIRAGGVLLDLVKWGHPFWQLAPKSRNNQIGNFFRQLNRFANGAKQNTLARYWIWASLMNEATAAKLIASPLDAHEYRTRKQGYLQHIQSRGSLNDVLYTDTQLVLPNDMLRKVDSMSMANALEVRTPFLDKNIVDFAFRLPSAYKINKQQKKRILHQAFKNELPAIVFERKKRGFEVPLLHWLKNDLAAWAADLLNEDFVRAQGIFNYKVIKQLKKRLHSNNPNEAVANIWAILVFQHWWRRYIG